MTGDSALMLLALGSTYVLGMWSGRAWALASAHVNGVLGSGLRAVDVNDAADEAEDEPELPYRPAAEPYRFTYDTALRDLKPQSEIPGMSDEKLAGLRDYYDNYSTADEMDDAVWVESEPRVHINDYKPAVPPTAQVAGEPEPPPATTTLSDRLAKGPW